ncbi:hypothetical protein [Aquisalimonas sp.]|uniref:sodium:solute symporter family transporter n=1 Tax=Aquisalimonas sp. TaxID=1872621 RepID=UPI0025BC3B02|nr:hypothetical protein [Aquisalimonas sp.]
MESLNIPVLTLIVVGLAVASVALSPRVRTADGFFRGWTETGQPPGVLTLTLSQVTTWIFARSLLNAGILGYFFGIAGVLAYTAYYGSFLTGWLITDRLRFHHGASSVQAFLFQRFGRTGTWCFNLLISLRLLSEVFANLLVIGIVFAAAGDQASNLAMVAVAAVTLIYSAVGGLRASLRTDALQMVLLGGGSGAAARVCAGASAVQCRGDRGQQPGAVQPGLDPARGGAVTGVELSAPRPGDDGPRLHRRPQDHAAQLSPRVLALVVLHTGVRPAGRVRGAERWR